MTDTGCASCGGSGLRADELDLPEDSPEREMLDSARCHTCAGFPREPGKPPVLFTEGEEMDIERADEAREWETRDYPPDPLTG